MGEAPFAKTELCSVPYGAQKETKGDKDKPLHTQAMTNPGFSHRNACLHLTKENGPVYSHNFLVALISKDLGYTGTGPCSGDSSRF